MPFLYAGTGLTTCCPSVRRSMTRGGRKNGEWWTIAVRMLAVWAAIWLASATMAEACDDGADAPTFRAGERLTFVLKWTVIPAGQAILEVLPREQVAGRQANHFVLKARSNAFVDAFYMVRDRIDAWSDVGMHQSLLYRKNQHEGGTRRDITVAFDWEAMTAQYSNRGEARKPIPITGDTFDPLSAFYFFRCLDLTVGGRVRRSVTDGKQHQLGIADVIRRETVSVPAGTFDTFLVEPDLAHVGGVFEKSPDAKIQVWVSADDRRLPVKLKSKVIVGSFSGELVSMVGVVPRNRSDPGEK
jgi:hypothetical protein